MKTLQNKLLSTVVLQALLVFFKIGALIEPFSNTVQLLIDKYCKLELSLMMKMADTVSARHLWLLSATDWHLPWALAIHLCKN